MVRKLTIVQQACATICRGLHSVSPETGAAWLWSWPVYKGRVLMDQLPVKARVRR